MSFQHRRPLSNTRGIRLTGLCSVPQLFCLFNNEITICPMGASVLGRSSTYPSLPLPLLSVSCLSKSHCFSRQTFLFHGQNNANHFAKSMETFPLLCQSLLHYPGKSWVLECLCSITMPLIPQPWMLAFQVGMNLFTGVSPIVKSTTGSLRSGEVLHIPSPFVQSLLA